MNKRREQVRPPGLAVILGLALVLGLIGLAAGAETGDYVGSAECETCHEGYTEALATTPHGKSGFEGLSSHGCEGGPLRLW